MDDPKVIPMPQTGLPNLEERALKITALQDAMLREAEAKLTAAQQNFAAVAGAIIAGHEINAARVLRIEPDHVLIVELSGNGKAVG